MGSVDVELESDSDFEEWLPSVLKRWAAFTEGGEGNAKRYTAFLRFVFKAYSIPARVQLYTPGGWAEREGARRSKSVIMAGLGLWRRCK